MSSVLDFLTSETWIKGDYTDGEGHYCLIGALRHKHSCAELSTLPEAYKEDLTKVFLALKTLEGHSNVVEYNDADKTTFEDIRILVNLAGV